MRYQYQVTTESDWTSNFGYSFLTLVNQSGSGRKLTLKSLEVQVLTAFCDSAGTLSPATKMTLYRESISSPLSGENMIKKSIEFDSTNSIPSTVVIRRNSNLPTYSNILRSVDIGRRGGAVGTQNTLFTNNSFSSRFGKQRNGIWSTSRGSGTVFIEPIHINQNQAIGLLGTVVNYSTPIEVSLVININGKSNIFIFNSIAKPGECLFTIENTGSDEVNLINYTFRELGTTDTPYIRVVPVGQLYATDIADTSKTSIKATPMDSSYPNLDALSAYTDIGCIPSGSPEVVINAGAPATAIPKGMNYLHTRDFNGPILRVFLPEMCDVYRGGGLARGDTLRLTTTQKFSDLLVRNSGITLNPGEGIALVSSAETAVGVQPAYSGWPSLKFTAFIDSEPQFSPYLNITGLIPGSDIVVLSPGSSTELINVDSYSSSTFSWAYDPDIVNTADICVYKQGYIPYSIRNLSLSTAGVTLPISQVPDRNFSA